MSEETPDKTEESANDSTANGKKKVRYNVDSTVSSQKGIAGIAETLLRKFRILTPLFLLSLFYFVAFLCIAISLTPGIMWVRAVHHWASQFQPWLHYFFNAFAMISGYFLYGLLIILVVPLANFVLFMRLKPWRGTYYSLTSVRWYIHNGLAYIVRYTFLQFITPSPINILYFRLMGMKIGEGVQINTEFISDPSMISIGDKVTIGGSVTLIGHYGVGGILIIAPIKIGKGATIGIKATIFPDVEIGEGAKILPHAVVFPKTRIPAGETWSGVPAKKVEPGNHSN